MLHHMQCRPVGLLSYMTRPLAEVAGAVRLDESPKVCAMWAVMHRRIVWSSSACRLSGEALLVERALVLGAYVMCMLTVLPVM
jgi:hypothetical protein